MPGRSAEPGVIWTRPERATRGPRPSYSRGDIAAAGVRIADAEGLEAVTMRRVAAELGCGTMSLYNYVPRKEDLHELMVDAVTGEYDLSRPPATDWYEGMLDLAYRTRELMHRHPWQPGLMLTSPVHGFSPNGLRFLEYTLICLDGLDLPYGAKLELIATVNGMVNTFVANELATAERTRSLPWSAEREQAVRGAYLARAVAGGEYPRLAAALAKDSGPVDPDAAFDRVVRRLLGSFTSGAAEAEAEAAGQGRPRPAMP
ncbi:MULTISPECIES: TetR/AcrR family transcriptional regulator [unclassified Streptomyces]|uniref:TetR/AcrR family transcriptional regulator n=1 Tax=unclassified Streptomyces TaxID=2593676 RepID=UPI002DD88887|nr:MULTISPECIES: TetR/AcrR family transcriptional regulator [unclassified Streptomyces]WSA96147.1 TetR/AcrR family transcriptional regulator [Streptomyces sp. NBC_01795]WSB80561.1 TetR/AcrR family transcriptional regulator [Streptomyces sp. NBC_01775]WSS11230.1 TetR/AcrR family transcriptional regulator [Streptomyces sp. NBC_01186]WSS39939.1 TetR/AcrR family transcriptional regulator [Streptomyces sp. NBC_01187]